MSNSYRIRTTPGVDKSIRVLIDQEFEYLEILSLKILQEQIYTRQCSDYGVIVGRVSVNNGFGIPNAKVSVFIPLTDEDATNPIISEIYPYKTVESINEDGYRYNLLPYVPSYDGHTPTGTFFDRDDVIYDKTLVEVYDKYYKYTTTTNDSGDYMIFGVPTGQQTIFVDIDLSDIGEFSLTPNDLIRMGIATPEMVNGTFFKSGTNLNVLPQLISFTRNIEIEPLWGEPEICNLGITRTDFDITKEIGLEIRPTAVFMGSIISDTDDYYVKTKCKPSNKAGNLCSLITGPGKILAIRQTIEADSNGRPILEKFNLENGGQVIDEDGAWVIDVPMNLDYVTTNEFGQQVISQDPKVGIPTKGKYRFKVKWDQPNDLRLNIRRGNFLVPNIKEWGWDNAGNINDPSEREYSYVFSLNWDDYGNNTTPNGQQMISEAVNCKDRFYEMKYNKIYTISSLISQYKKGGNKKRLISIKNILDESCESINNKFPTNDAQLKGDFTFSLVAFFMGIFAVIGPVFILLMHIIKLITCLILFTIGTLFSFVGAIFQGIANLAKWAGFKSLAKSLQKTADRMNDLSNQIKGLCRKFELRFCLMSYPDCETCEKNENQQDFGPQTPSSDGNQNAELSNLGILTKFYVDSNYTCPDDSIENQQEYFRLFYGFADGPLQPCSNCGYKSEGVTKLTNGDYIFTSNLTFPHRLNLFNTKGKYFDGLPGGGVNQIKVTFDTNLNNPNTQFHLDNVMCLMINSADIGTFPVGQLLSLVDPSLSTDPNITGSTINIYGNNAITGTTIGTPIPLTTINQYQRQVSYANPNNSGNIPGPIYTLTATTDTNQFAKFKIDIEYFQVIHTTTVNNYISNSDPLNLLPNSLKSRFLQNSVYTLELDGSLLSRNCVLSTKNYQLNNCFENFGEEYLVFLVRGVDPNTNKVPCRYDLSKVYGYNGFGLGPIVTDNFYLNIPIQGTSKCVKHNLVNNTTLDSYSNTNLYYDAYQFIPSPDQFSGFTSSQLRFYSNLDTTTSPLPLNAAVNGPDGSLTVSSLNEMSQEWNQANSSLCGTYYTPTSNIMLNARGYYPYEPVEGGSLLFLNATINPPLNPLSPFSLSQLVSNIYPIVNMSFNLGGSGRQIVMRSDRLPSSSQIQSAQGEEYLLFENSNFTVYQISETGESTTIAGAAPSVGSGDSSDFAEDYSGSTGDLLETFNCDKMVPLKCYDVDSNGKIIVKPLGDKCYETLTGEPVMENGCFNLVQTPLITFPGDILRFEQWISRLMATFGVCRGLFGHMFTNNWINGTLYMFPFKVNTTFNSQNEPSSKFCEDVIYFHSPTNNFYYRSAPYNRSSNMFPGSENPGYNEGNDRLLLFPTTMLDLGPKLEFLGNVSLSADYKDYIADKLQSSTFQDVSDIINLFIIGRLVSASNPLGVYSYFSRPNKMIDGDYAQMVSINSEFGVDVFDTSNYTGNDIFTKSSSPGFDSILGIFFKSNLQDRDFITPKRIILSGSVPLSNSDCGLSNIDVFTQEVPFYRWNIKNNPKFKTIFGDQKTNDWETTEFLKHKYQDLDRLLPASNYFRTTNTTQTDYFKGYIYAVNGNVPATIDADIIYWNNDNKGKVLVGAPFHFYFGLRKGKSSFDKFAQIWLPDTEIL